MQCSVRSARAGFGADRLTLSLESLSVTAQVRANILGGGDNCSRAAVVGGLLGAAVRSELPPPRFPVC